MAATREFERRFQALLEELDAAAEDADDEDLREINAEFEDALLLLHEIDPESPDGMEEFQDAMDEFDALRADYARLDATREIAGRLAMMIEMARGIGEQPGPSIPRA